MDNTTHDEYRIVIDGGDGEITCDSYELIYAHNGEVMTVGGCKALAEGSDRHHFKETWLSQKIKKE